MLIRAHTPFLAIDLAPYPPEVALARALCTGEPTELGRAVCVAGFALNDGNADNWIQLLPAGEFAAVDGRPAGLVDGKGKQVKCKKWFINAEVAAKVIARANARQNDFPIDYEHQTDEAKKNGKPAPAAGWFKELAWREGQGLFALVKEWTINALAMIKAHEYRFVSADFDFIPDTGEVYAINMAGLTNKPGIHGMAAVTATEQPNTQTSTGENTVLQKLIALLGLAATATEEQVTTAVATLKESLTGATAEIATLKSKAATAVPLDVVQTLQTEIATLKGAQQSREVEELVSAALKEGKLPLAMVDWARNTGKTNFALLKEYIDKAPAIPALSSMQTTGRKPVDAATVQLTEAQQETCRVLGIKPEDYKAEMAKEGSV